MKRVGLRTKFIVLFAVVAIVSLPVSLVWIDHAQKDRAESEMLEKAQILTQEMDAVWEFMEVNQHRMKSAADMGYATDDLYCVVAAKSVSKSFTLNTDYVIHYTNLETRQIADAPDEFETRALMTFHEAVGSNEYYGQTTHEGKRVFRYVKPIYATESCLECHGDPAGEIDVTGFPKEGLKKGDIAGAISIIMPVDLYLDGVRESTYQQVAFTALILLVGIAVIYFAVTKLVVKPLGRLTSISNKIERDDYDIDFSDIGDRDEVSEVASNLDTMVARLRSLNVDLEQQVSARTGQLAAANVELEQHRKKLIEANDKLERAIQRLREENQYKSDFLAIMSHELRTPLTAILASIELWEKAENNRGNEGGRESHEIVQEIKINSQLLLNMVNNTLEMARIEARRADVIYEYVDLFDLASIVAKALRPLAASKDITLEVDVDRSTPIIRADVEKLRRIMENLVNNAIKFTHNGCLVRVDIGPVPNKNEVYIRVTDNGIGISPDKLPTIFEKFERGDSPGARSPRGSGLGLAVVKELAEMHGGCVEVVSRKGEGSCFTVYIPTGEKEMEYEDNAC